MVKKITTIGPREKLNFSPNEFWKGAVWILSKKLLICADRFIYKLEYGCYNDYVDANKKTAHSSWDLFINSEPDESFEDFVIRLSETNLLGKNAGWCKDCISEKKKRKPPVRKRNFEQSLKH